MLKITKINDNTYEVDVRDSVETTHRVTLNDAYYQQLTSGNISKEKLIEESFQFLLDHESNTQILREFTLETIEQYFPSFPGEIKNRF